MGIYSIGKLVYNGLGIGDVWDFLAQMFNTAPQLN